MAIFPILLVLLYLVAIIIIMFTNHRIMVLLLSLFMMLGSTIYLLLPVTTPAVGILLIALKLIWAKLVYTMSKDDSEARERNQ